MIMALKQRLRTCVRPFGVSRVGSELPGKLALMGSAYRVPNILAQLKIACVQVVSLDQRCTLVSVIRHHLL
jgi:hypothetical protein